MHSLTVDSKAIGDSVILRNITNTNKEVDRSGIIIPDKIIENTKVVKAEVISIGEEVEYIQIGDIVMYDKHSVFSDTGRGSEKNDELVITKAENIIGKIVG